MTDAPSGALPADERPFDRTPVHTADLPPTPTRQYSIPGSAWVEAPAALLDLAEAAGIEARYLRRIGPWLLWRVGPARGDHADYWAARADDLTVQATLHLDPDGSGRGSGPSGVVHSRFRTWKEDLRDHAQSS